MRFILLVLFSTFFIGEMSAKPNQKIVVLLNDASLSRNEINDWLGDVYFKKKYKVNDFILYHITDNNDFNEPFTSKKKTCKYYTKRPNCQVSQCEILSDVIQNNRSEASQLLLSQQIDCNFLELNIPAKITGSTTTSIGDDIVRILSENKKLKKDLTIFIHINGSSGVSKPEITVDQDTLFITEGETAFFDFEAKNVNKYVWSPAEDVSCFTCNNVELKPTQTTTYEFYGTNGVCDSETHSVTVVVKKACTNNFGPTEIRFDCGGKKYNYDAPFWEIIARSAGSKRYEFICESNCGETFKVKIIDDEGITHYSKTFKRSEVDKRANNDYHSVYPDLFVFSLNLARIPKKVMYDDEKTFYFIVESNDEDNNEYEEYKSPALYFRPCSN